MANDLLEIRQKFITFSGRMDLATTDTVSFDTDAGADFFIKAGQDFLDRRFKHAKSVSRYFDEVAAGTWYLKFQRCRAVKEVWANNDEERYKLTKIDYDTLKDSFDSLVSAQDQGQPLYYHPAFLRSAEATDINSLGTFFNHIEANSDSYNGVLFLPPPDEAYVIEVNGLWYSDELSGNTINSFWTEVHPMALVWAALYMLEVTYRNTAGAKDWLTAIDTTYIGVEMDQVEEDIAEYDQMEG